MNITHLHPIGQQTHLAAEALSLALSQRAEGASVSSIAAQINIPRSTLRDRLAAHDVCPLPDILKDAFASPEGHDFLKRLAISTHVLFRDVCACGLRVIGTFLRWTGLDALVGASLGCQWALGKAIDEGIVEFGKCELERMVPHLAGKEISAALDENFHEGPCLVGIEPASNFILTEALTRSRDTQEWHDAMVPVIARLGVKVFQVASDSGSAILSLAENILHAHHSPDLFHILYDFRRTFLPAMRKIRRDIERRLAACEKELRALGRMMERWEQLTPVERGRGRPPRFEHLKKDQEALFNSLIEEYAMLDKHDATVKAALRLLSENYHPVCKQTGKRIGNATFENLLLEATSRIRAVIVELDLDICARDALAKLEKMGEKMAATLAMISLRWGERATAACVSARERYAIEALLAPAQYLERLAARTTTLKAHGLQTLACALKAEAIKSIGEIRVRELTAIATAMAEDFQRSTSMVEGRNGQLSLRHHAFHELSMLKRHVLTTLHNYVIERADGTTASERFSGVKPSNLLGWLCENLECLPKASARRSVRKSA